MLPIFASFLFGFALLLALLTIAATLFGSMARVRDVLAGRPAVAPARAVAVYRVEHLRAGRADAAADFRCRPLRPASRSAAASRAGLSFSARAA